MAFLDTKDMERRKKKGEDKIRVIFDEEFKKRNVTR